MKKIILLFVFIAISCISANAGQVMYQVQLNTPVKVTREVKPTICFDNCQPGQIRIPESARDGRRMRKMNGIRHRTMQDRSYVKNYAKPRTKEKCKHSRENVSYRTQRRQAYMRRYDSDEYKQYINSKKPKQLSRFDRQYQYSHILPPKPKTVNGITYYNVRPL